jgi:predicted metal-binding membrane protein
MSMSSTGAMQMPGDGTMSMAWMRMPGQSWAGAGASYLCMWVVMMVAMMMPSLAPMLLGYRNAVSRLGTSPLGRLTVLVALAYFLVWSLIGLIAFPLGVALAALEMANPALARAVPTIAGAVVILAGALQFTAWKAHHLACCRRPIETGSVLAGDARTAWDYGLRIGLHCGLCCAGLTAILFVLGVMDLRAMAAIATAITVERLVPAGERAARMVGVIAIGVGLFLMAQSAGLV